MYLYNFFLHLIKIFKYWEYALAYLFLFNLTFHLASYLFTLI